MTIEQYTVDSLRTEGSSELSSAGPADAWRKAAGEASCSLSTPPCMLA